MGAKKIEEVSLEQLYKPKRLITAKEAIEFSEGYYTCIQSIRNLICRGVIKRYGPPKQIQIDYDEFMQYLGRSEDNSDGPGAA